MLLFKPNSVGPVRDVIITLQAGFVGIELDWTQNSKKIKCKTLEPLSGAQFFGDLVWILE
jgi:hypothetical protein